MSHPTLGPEELRYAVQRYLTIKSAGSPSFSPDDTSIAYLTDVTGTPQIWSISIEGDGPEQWPQQVTLGKDRVGFLSYAHLGNRMVCGIDSGGDERFQLKLIQGSGEKLVSLTSNPSVIHSFGDWSPDEQHICYSANGRNPAFFDIYTQSLDDSEGTPVYQNDGNNYPVSWSRDGSTILFTRMHAPFDHDLFVLRLRDGTVERVRPHEGDAVYTSATFDPTGRFVYCISDEGREFPALARIDVSTHSLTYLHTEDKELEGLSLSRDGKTLAFTVNVDGFSRLMLLRSDSSEAAETVTIPRSVVGSMSWSNDGECLALSLSSSSMNSDVWLLRTRDRSIRRLTRSSTNGIPDATFSQAESFHYNSFDGLDIQAFVYRSPVPGPRPLVVILHGGPESQFRPGFNPLVQFLVRLGFVVVAPNFRGSTGYGRNYTHLDDVYKRMDTVKDALLAVEKVRERTQIDTTKIVAWGGSYGGFMVLASLYTAPEIWAAGVDIVGISNFVTFLENTGPWRRKLRIAEYGDPKKDREFLEGISPLNNAHLIRAPLFLIHGANDPRVPVGEAGQIIQTMQNLGREAHLLLYPDEGHGLVKLENRVDGYSKAIEFIMAHISQ